MRKLITVALATSALVTAGCGKPSGSTPPTGPGGVAAATTTAPSGRVTIAQIAKAFISYDTVQTRVLPRQESDDCDRLAINQTPSTYYPAWVVISPSDNCDTTMSLEKSTHNAMPIERNIWIEYADGTDSATRAMVQALTLAAYVVMDNPGSGYGPDG